MIDELVNLEEDVVNPPTARVDLNEPQPWFLKFTEPIFQEEEEDDDDKPMRNTSGEKFMLILQNQCEHFLRQQDFYTDCQQGIFVTLTEIKFPWPPGAPRPLFFKTEVTLQEVLDFICPPIEISEDGYHWKQFVSDEAPNRTYEAFLKKCLEEALRNVRSRFSGFCPYRNKVYRDMFSEVIRAVTVGMKERGLLLLRIKDDIDTTVDRMSRLYKSSMRYGYRKAVRVEEKKLNLEMKIEDMREETYVLRMVSKNFIAKSLAAVEELRSRKLQFLYKKNFDLELLKRATCVIEKCIFRVISSCTRKQRERFYKTCLLYKEETESELHVEEDPTGLFTEVKTPSSSTDTILKDIWKISLTDSTTETSSVSLEESTTSCGEGHCNK